MRRLLRAQLIVLVLLLAPTAKAWAWVCCDPWGAVGMAAFVTAGQSVVTSVTTSTTTLVMRLQTIYTTLDSNFARATGEQAKQGASQKLFRQGTVAAGAQFYTASRAAEAAENAVPPSGLAVTVTNSLLLSEQRNVVRQKIAAADAAFASSLYASKATDASIVMARHKPYCSGADVSAGRCDSAASPTMQNADLTINTILTPGEGQYETLSDEERDAAVAFVQQVVNPIPAVRAAQKNMTPQEKALDARMLADQAALSLAAHSLNAAIAHRTRKHQQ